MNEQQILGLKKENAEKSTKTGGSAPKDDLDLISDLPDLPTISDETVARIPPPPPAAPPPPPSPPPLFLDDENQVSIGVSSEVSDRSGLMAAIRR